MMMPSRNLCLFLLLLSLSCSLGAVAYAQSSPDAPKLAAGQTSVTLSANESKQLTQDLLQASLRIEVTDKDAKKIQDKINTAMKSAVDMAKSVPEVKVSTGQYYVYSYDPSPVPAATPADIKKRQVWRGSQTIEIQGTDSQKVLDIAGKVQELGFLMNGLNYMLSPEKGEAAKDELMTSALATIKRRADLMAKTLGKSGYDLVEIAVENNFSGGGVMPMMAARAVMADGVAESKMASPVAEPGQSQVNLTVNAKIVLKP